MNSQNKKLIKLEEVSQNAGETVVLCHGHFNIIHPGHIRYLDYARQQGSKLVVSILGDSSFLNFERKHHFLESERASGVAAIQIVDQVILLGDGSLEELIKIVSLAKSVGKTVVFTNGCFDLIHGGHIEFLQKAKDKGDILVLGLNSDKSVTALKGEGRPIKTEKERANIISALKYVDYITIFDEETPEEIIREVRPDILVKGDDYDINKVVGREIVEGYGAKVELIPIVKGLSTTNIVEKIIKNYKTEETT